MTQGTPQPVRDDSAHQVADATLCKPGQAHHWTYRGTGRGYRCELCGGTITKERLKKETD